MCQDIWQQNVVIRSFNELLIICCVIKWQLAIIYWQMYRLDFFRTRILTTVKEFLKSVKIWQSYCPKFGGFLFWNTVYIQNYNCRIEWRYFRFDNIQDGGWWPSRNSRHPWMTALWRVTLASAGLSNLYTFFNITSIAAIEKRPLSYKTPQSFHTPRYCGVQTFPLEMHYGGEKLGKNWGRSGRILTPAKGFLLLGFRSMV